MKAPCLPLLLPVCIFILFVSGCFSALPPEEEENPEPVETEDFESAYAALRVYTPSRRRQKQPLILVHYMPWYRGPSDKSQENNKSVYGGHWTGWGGIDPTRTRSDGRAEIYARQYPLTGPYDQSTVYLLEYQAVLFKLAGIDGVIFDWYGNRNVNDFGEIHEHTKAMVEVLKRVGLQFTVCYEDNTINMEYGGRDNVPAGEALESGKEVFRWMQQNWFNDNAYIRLDDQPLVMCFGPQYFSQAQWDELFAAADPRPFFADLMARTSWADATYNWPSMNGRKPVYPGLVNDLNGFYNSQKDNPCLIASAWPAFDDVYEDIGQTSYGDLAYADGETFKLTFKAALDSWPDIIQIATWNDYGEGTIIEPTIERGYRELEYLQDRRKEWDSGFPYTREDLRIPLEFYKLQYLNTASAAPKTVIADAYDALFAGNAAGLRTAAEKAGIRVSVNDLKPLLRK
ncbi:MAG: glycoside hydrolase family 99-like domain-containing protein [Treponema sp.]|jgi:hypothetical protein|nr:glycoside hydrolase family 99-like domain-containing protein [Treponema sp.]